jgi:monoamine oxidase
MDIWDYTRSQPGTRGILGAYMSGRIAKELTALDAAARGRLVLRGIGRAHPGIVEQVEGTASKSWIEDPWARGAGAEFGAGQLSKHYAAIRAAEGRLYFAGDYTSPWHGWMNGALESGQRIADAILARDANR